MAIKTIRKSYCGVSLSKQDEIDVLQYLRASFEGAGHYLSGLFTTSMVEYCSDKIRDDFTPDLMSELINSSVAISDLEVENRSLRSELANSRNTVERMSARIMELENELGERIDRVTELHSELARCSTRCHNTNMWLRGLKQLLEEE